MTDIKPYMTTRQGAINWYHYLHIKGGTGKRDGHGGQYAYYLTYLIADNERIIDCSLDYYCKDKGIPCGVGDTIEEAYNDFQSQLIRIPLK